jgi:hypothetical protein
MLATSDHALDGKRVGLCELEVAFVVARHGHDRAGSVAHQDVVGDPDRDALAVDRVDHRPPDGHAGLRSIAAALVAPFGQRVVDVVADRLLLLRSFGQPHDVGMLRRHHEEGRSEQRVGPGGEHGELDPGLGAVEDDLGALGAADPVALHRDDVVRPLDRGEIVEQAIGVVGDPEEPLLELPGLDLVAAPLAVPIDHLLVGEHRLVVGAPVDRRLASVGEPALVQAQEEPLRPAVVPGLVGAELARPVDGDAPGPELLLKEVIELAVESLGCSPVRMAWFSAGSPKAS